ncbi:MAG: hypothetical protein P1P81_10140 [Desulfobulbales bacterium]|nr:hypothetical protein [Desulfobulbales bacterium]
MARLDILKKQQARLSEDIAAMLDSFVIGSVARSPSMSGHNLTTKVQGKTVTRYVRKDLVPKVLEMSGRYKKLWSLMQELSKVNFEILRLEQS